MILMDWCTTKMREELRRRGVGNPPPIALLETIADVMDEEYVYEKIENNNKQTERDESTVGPSAVKQQEPVVPTKPTPSEEDELF